MKAGWGVVGGRMVFMALLLMFAAGCNESGVRRDDPAPTVTVMSLPSEPDGSGGLSDMVTVETFGDAGDTTLPEDPLETELFSVPGDEGSSDLGEVLDNELGNDNGGNEPDAPEVTNPVVKVHNPEPGSMILMGIGLGSLLRRRKSIKK